MSRKGLTTEKGSGSRAGPWLLGVGGVAAVTALATVFAIRDDSRGELSLGILTPAVQVADEIGWWLLRDPLRWMTRLGVGVGVLAVVVGILLWRHRRDAVAENAPQVLVALGLALIGQLSILQGWVLFGLIFFVSAAIVVVAGHVLGWNGIEFAGERWVSPPNYREAMSLLAIGSVAVAFRYYALNRMLNFFEGELSPYMAGATNFKGLLLANIGWMGPWAPMGLLYYLPIWAMSLVGGSTVLAVRLASAVIGILTIVVVYVVVRGVIGRTVALWSAALMAVDTLQVGWGRSDMHPHASTAWPGILLFGATVRALSTGATGWYVAVMLLMGLSWHQYPSGQFVVIVPVIGFAAHAILNRGFLRTTWHKSLFIAAGAVLWIVGYPLASLPAVGRPYSPLEYISKLGPRLLGGGDDVVDQGASANELIVTVSQNVWDVVLGLFSGAPRIFHQTVIPNVEGLTLRALPWYVVASAVVGLTLCVLRFREKWSAPLLALVAAGALPAILSDVAWLKRASLLYVALIIIAALPLAIVTDGLFRKLGRRARWVGGGCLAVAFLLSSSIWAHLWFSGRQYEYGVPAETVIAEALEKHIEPKTLLIFSMWGEYIQGELTYLLHDALTERQPVAFYIIHPRHAGWRTLLAFPREVLLKIDTRLWYWLWTGLGDEIPEIVNRRDWSRVVYLIEDRPDVESDFEVLADRCPDLLIERIFVGRNKEVFEGEVLPRYHVWIARCDNHRGLRTPSFATPALP